jgi:hypothetical protein
MYVLLKSYHSLHFQTKNNTKQVHNPQCGKSLKEQNQLNIMRENTTSAQIKFFFFINLSKFTFEKRRRFFYAE